MTQVELTRRERKKEETKERILQAAFALFRKRGVEATTVDEICEKADVAKGTFFNYFPRKEAVFSYLSETWVADLEETIGELFGKSGPAFRRVLDAFVQTATFYEEDRELSKHMVAEWTRTMYEPDNDVCRRWDDLGVGVIRQLQARREIRADVDPVRAHRILGDVYHGAIIMWLEAPEPPYPLKDELRRRLTLVMQGLGPQA